MSGERERVREGNGVLARYLARLDALSVRAKALTLAALFAAIVVMDAATGLDLTLRALYLLPVAAAAWLLGNRAGILLAVLSVAVSSYYDVKFGLARTNASFVYSDAVMRFAVYLAAAAVLARLHAVQERLREAAQTDPLTGLYNRRGFRLLAEREIERSKRTGASLTLVSLDLDGFKALNDTRGHADGDVVLIAVGRSLQSSRAIDLASRLGGDEFALLLPDTTGEAAATAVRRIVSDLDEAMAAQGWPITFSVGAATFPVPHRSLDEMLRVVDDLMYEVKSSGKAGIKLQPNGDHLAMTNRAPRPAMP